MNGSSSQLDGKSTILAAVDIVQLIGQSVPLKRRGREFIGLCPFHQEKTPSFHVSPAKQFYHCFGCKKHGNAIDFVMERDRIDFKEALVQLAAYAGVELPHIGGRQKQDKSERQILLDAQSAACGFFESVLKDPLQGRAAREYLDARRFSSESIRQFRLGMAPAAWDGLLSSNAGRKFSSGQLERAGLVKPNTRGDGHYDTFRNRLIFPIRDELGRIIAFGGRVLPGSDDPAKYLNSPETPIFSKSRCIFGLDLAKARIVETRTVAVVEGYADVVMAHQYGVTNVVSVLGTALTEAHVLALKRFADKIVLLFDPDSAGEAATERAIGMLLRHSIDIHVVSLADDLDPDEFLLKYGREAFERAIGDAPDALSHQWSVLCRRYNPETGAVAQQAAMEAYLRPLAEIRGEGVIDPIRWGAILARVSRILDVSPDMLNRRFAGTVRGRRHQPVLRDADRPTGAGLTTGALDWSERTVLGVLLVDPGRWLDIQQQLRPVDFTQADRAQLARIYWDYQSHEGVPEFNEFLDLLKQVQLGSLGAELASDALALENRDLALTEALDHLAAVRIRMQEQKQLAALRRTRQEKVSDEEEIARLRAFEKSNQPGMHRLGPMRMA